jgi:tetratricopeptide (TPR) repeat protein
MGVVVGVLGLRRQFYAPPPAFEPPGLNLSSADPALVQAVQEARAAVKQSPNSAAAWGRLGMVFLAHTILVEGETCLAQARRLDPKNGQWAYLLGLVIVRTRPEEGIQELNEAVKLCGQIPAPRLRLGESLLEQGELDEAEAQFQAVLEYDAGNPRAEAGLGRIARARGRLEKSLVHLRRSVERAPNVRETHVILAEVYDRLGKTAEAKRELKELTRLPDQGGPTDPYLEAVLSLQTGPDARRSLAQNLIAQGRRQEALAVMAAAVREHPDSYLSHLFFGNLLLEDGSFGLAEAEFRELIRLRPEHQKAHEWLGVALLRQGKLEQATEVFRRAVKLNAQSASCQEYLAVCLKNLGCKQEAIVALRTAIKCKPDAVHPRRELIELLMQEGHFPEARSQAQDLVRLSPADQSAKQLLVRAQQGAHKPPP